MANNSGDAVHFQVLISISDTTTNLPFAPVNVLFNAQFVQRQVGRIFPDVSWDRNTRPSTIVAAETSSFIEAGPARPGHICSNY